jgi:tetratricopeptide (TPR) repeat protein
MTRERKRIKTLVAGGALGSLLVSSALYLVVGCSRATSQSPASSAGVVPSEPSERELLAEIEKKFENPEAHYELGRLYARAGQWSKAEYHYNVALGFDPALRAAQAGLVKLFLDEGQKAKAEQYASSYIRQVSTNDRELLRLAWEFEKVGLDEYALRCFRQALVVAPDSYEVNKQVGFYYLGKNDTAKARQYLSRSFELNPRQPDVSGALGKLGVVVESPQAPPMTTEKKQ